MTALEYYANASKFVMACHDLNDSYLLLLKEALTPLRFFMACRVCNQILKDPMSPDHTVCQHTVCSNCVGGKMRLKPSCGWCQKYENFVENKPLKALIKCYSKLCEYILNSIQYRRQVQFLLNVAGPEEQECAESVACLLNEGCEAHMVIPEIPLPTLVTPPRPYPGKSSTITAEPAHQLESPQTPYRGDLKLKLVIPGGSDTKVVAPKRRRHATDPLANGSSPTKKRSSLLNKSSKRVAASLSESSIASSEGECSYSESSPLRHKVNKVPVIQEDIELSGNSQDEEDSAKKRVKKADKLKLEKKGCGCGTAASNPGKLTCYGQRCPCYSLHSPCLDCRCRGCRNPNKIVKIEQASEDTDGDEINVE